MSFAIIFGTRPQIIKSAPIIHEALKSGLELKIIHTSQHYDYDFSQVSIEEPSLPEPSVNLGVGLGSHAYQTGEIMLRLEKYWPGEDTLICLAIKRLGKNWSKLRMLLYIIIAVLLVPHLKQVSRFGLHRGFFAKRFRGISFKLTYFAPSLLVLSLFAGVFASLIN